MPGPTLTFGFILATLLGALFHLVLGGDIRRLATFLLAGWLGFILGHIAGVLLDVELFNVGTLRILPAIFGAMMSLIFAQALTINRSNRRPSR
ncbi:MAG: hypothetical protein OHK0046_07190 [Anaerolineae bacterium]